MIVTIIGLGLIGGSMALSLKQSGFATQIIGIDNNLDHQNKAMELGLVDKITSLKKGVQEGELIIIATPVNHILSLAPQILDLIDQQIVMDVGSTKKLIMESIIHHPKNGRFVGTHPMAGTEYSGPESAINNLFQDKSTVIVDKENVDSDALNIVEKLYTEMGMNILYHQSDEHDMHTAYISHISHISSFALALTVLEKERNEKRIFELAGGGFRSTVRLAKSNPDTWIPIFEQNRDYVLDVLDEHINTISQFRTLLIKKDFSSFHKKIEHANKINKLIN